MQHDDNAQTRGASDFDITQLSVTGRKAWKTMKGKGEAVWPPHLEKALLQGLAAYEPDTKSTKALNRFPRRNRFISEYIYQRTGEWRTAKQVSSRLQQLKESCKDDKILEKLKLDAYNQSHSSHGSEGSSPPASTPTPPCMSLSDSQRIHRAASAMQDVVFPHTFCLAPMASDTEMHIDLNNRAMYDAPTFLSPNMCEPPLLCFSSRGALFSETVCTIFEGDAILPLLSAACPLSFYGFSQERDQLLWHYTAALPASIWHVLCERRHPSHFRVLQNVIMDHGQTHDGATSREHPAAAHGSPMVSVLHRFYYSPPPALMGPMAMLPPHREQRVAPIDWECGLPSPPPNQAPAFESMQGTCFYPPQAGGSQYNGSSFEGPSAYTGYGSSMHAPSPASTYASSSHSTYAPSTSYTTYTASQYDAGCYGDAFMI
ncbi:TEA/ATTS domain family-domain-containing protein [Schizophyllum commune]